ncbi:hypothetical protein HDU91_005347 [Kappamyces sp. JEL0680]|nr:hypothetical protein HDU91_005347 [Kappamyces sp. JEL0680]
MHSFALLCSVVAAAVISVDDTVSTAAADKVITYRGYSLQYNCAQRTADRWTYTLGHDYGTAARPSSFYKDPNLASSCLQQLSTASYGSGYDRGHLVTSNDMDVDAATIKESHYMTNVVPQVSSFNQGIWAQGEKIHDCYRDINPVTVYGGVVYTDSSNDIFLDSHGIKTPDYMWKVILTKDTAGNDKIISWYIPNKTGLGTLASYLVSVSYIESKLNDGLGAIPVPAELKSYVAPSLWPIPSNCDFS